MIKIERFLIAMMGLLCSCGTVVAIGFGETRFAIVNFVYIAFIIYGFKKWSRYFNIKKANILMCLFFMYICIISAYAFIADRNELTRRPFTLSLKISFVCLGVAASWSVIKNHREKLELFLHYFYINCIVQMIWSWIERLSYSLFGFKFNDFIFGKILSITSVHQLTFVQYGRIRPSGLSWEPANLALVLVMGYALSKKPVFKVLFAVSLLLTTSSTGVFMLAVVLAFEVIKLLKERKMKISRIIAIVTIPFIGILLLIIVESKTGLVSFYLAKLDFIIGRSDGNDSNALAHMMYYQIYINLLTKLRFPQLLFGAGTFMAGQVISNSGLFLYRLGIYWNPETDVITLLLGSGWIGAYLYYRFIYRSLKTVTKTNHRKLILAVLAGGITYLYLEATWPLVIVVILYCSNSNVPTFLENSKGKKDGKGRHYISQL